MRLVAGGIALYVRFVCVLAVCVVCGVWCVVCVVCGVWCVVWCVVCGVVWCVWCGVVWFEESIQLRSCALQCPYYAHIVFAGLEMWTETAVMPGGQNSK